MVNQATQGARYHIEISIGYSKNDKDYNSLINGPDDDIIDIQDDPDWEPESICCEFQDATEPHRIKKFIVFENKLNELLDACPMCNNSMDQTRTVIGTCLCVLSSCKCGYTRQWESQPFSGTMPWGNLTLAGALFFTGNSPTKTLQFLTQANIATISSSTYNSLQTIYLVPSVFSEWQLQQSIMLDSIRESGRPLKLGGDARCSSPGHTAKYGSYTLMDVQNSKIVDMQMIQCNEVKNSYAMEMEGLKRCFHYLEDENGIVISDLVTDRHSQIKKYMRTEKVNIRHWFDVWHVAKGIYKKLDAIGKRKGYGIVGDWARSISNHVYWCAASSNGDGELVKDKWLSISNHISNIHTGHGKRFSECEHEPLTESDRKWMKKDGKQHREVEKVVCGKLLLTDIQKLSPAEQTSSLESFHNVVCYFAPKTTHYFYHQMKARLCLAALHFNANSGRDQAKRKDGESQFKVSYPKSRRGAAVAQQVKVKQTFDYVESLMDELVTRRQTYDSHRKARTARDTEVPDAPQAVTALAGHRTKEDVVTEHCQRKIVHQQVGYLKPQYCSEGNVFLIVVTTHDGNNFLFLLPSSFHTHLTKRLYAI